MKYPMSSQYGKSKVHVMKIVHPNENDQKHCDVFDFDVEVLLKGDLEEAYTQGNNAMVVPTDTVKNLCYVMAKNLTFESIEDYAWGLAQNFLQKYTHITHCKVSIEESSWNRMYLGGDYHDHCFSGGGNEKHTCTFKMDKNGNTSMTSGIKDMKIMKTTQSGFEGYPIDKFTTLKPTNDRIFCTEVIANWHYGSNPPKGKFHLKIPAIKEGFMKVFAGPNKGGVHSNSVQETMYQMCCTTLNEHPEIEYIEMTLPNIHHFNFNLEQFGLENKNEVLFRSDKPSGNIQCTVYKDQMVKENHENYLY